MVDPLSSPDLFKRATDNSAERAADHSAALSLVYRCIAISGGLCRFRVKVYLRLGQLGKRAVRIFLFLERGV